MFAVGFDDFRIDSFYDCKTCSLFNLTITMFIFGLDIGICYDKDMLFEYNSLESIIILITINYKI